MQGWITLSKNIAELDSLWLKKAKKRLDEQTRPLGSLGRLEDYIARFVAIQKKEKPSSQKKRILIFAADHGVTEEGVSAYPREVTPAMVLNFLNGGATINALARQIQAEVLVVDMGVDADFGSEPNLVHAKIAHGTKNMTQEPAMTIEQLDQALSAGWNLVHEAHKDGVEIIGLGEMGIGNTTAASAVIASLTHHPVESVTGRGTGADDATLLRKIEVIKKALARHQKSFENPLNVLQCVGGFELAAMTGAILAAAKLGLPIVVDGWIVSASALAAIKLNPRVLDYLFFSHQSEELGHKLFFEELDVKPILNLSMRLGEASGAAFAMGILEAGIRIYNEVATFAEAGVANREK